MFFKKKKSFDSNVYRFVEGTIIPLDTVKDPVFAQKMMGDGIAIEPTESTITAPCSGVVSVVFPTGHAYGISRDDGVDLLIHLGIDTVELNGEGFTQKVKQGQRVEMGDVLGTADWEFIKSKGKETSAMLIVTSGQTIKNNSNEDNVLFTVTA